MSEPGGHSGLGMTVGADGVILEGPEGSGLPGLAANGSPGRSPDAAPSTAALPDGIPVAGGSQPATSERLWRNHDFRVVLVGQGISAVGDAVTFTALPLLVAALTGSGMAMGIVGALGVLPDLLLGLPAGALADRWDRRLMMLWADVGRAILTALVPLSVILGWDTMTVVLLVTAPINVLRVIYMAAYTAVMPSLVGRDQVGRAAGFSEAIMSISFMLGPVLAGLLVGIIGAASTLALDAITFAVSAASLLLVRRPLQAARERRRSRFTADIAEGLRYVVGERTLRSAIVAWSAYSVVTAPLVTVVIYLLTIDAGVAPAVVGIILGVHAAGWLVGALLGGRLSHGPLGRIMLLATAAQAPILAAFALVSWIPGEPAQAMLDPQVQAILQSILAAAVGASQALALIAYLTLRTTIPPDDMLGRVGSTARTISVGLTPLGIFIGGIALDLVGGPATLLIMAILVGVVAAVFTFSGSLRAARAGRGSNPAPSPVPSPAS